MRALASHRSGSGSILGLDAKCGLSWFLVLFSAPRGFSPGTTVFPSPQKPTFPNFNSILISVDEWSLCGGATTNSHYQCYHYYYYYNHKNYNFLNCGWFKKLLFPTNSLAKLLSDSLLSDSLLLDSRLSRILLGSQSRRAALELPHLQSQLK